MDRSASTPYHSWVSKWINIKEQRALDWKEWVWGEGRYLSLMDGVECSAILPSIGLDLETHSFYFARQ